MERKKISFAEKVLANIEKQNSQRTRFRYLHIPDGIGIFRAEPNTRVRLDFLPYIVTDPNHPDRDDEKEAAVPGTLWYRRPFKTHKNVGYDNVTLVCPTSIGKHCPICEYRQKLLKEGKSWQDKAVSSLTPSSRSLYIVVPLDSKNYEEKPHIWDFSDHLFQNKLNIELHENREYAIFADLEEGYTLRIRFIEGQAQKAKFPEANRIDFEERQKKYDKSILDKVPNLDEVLVVLSYEQIEAKFFDSEEDTITDVDNAIDEVVEELVEDEEEISSRKPKTVVAKPVVAKSKSTTAEGECPHGHVFGKDEGAYPECAECAEWNACADAKDELGG